MRSKEGHKSEAGSQRSEISLLRLSYAEPKRSEDKAKGRNNGIME